MKSSSSPVLFSGEHRTAFLIALALLMCSAVALGAIVTSLRLQLRKLPIHAPNSLKFHTLPSEFPGWKVVRDEQMSADAAAELGTDNYITRWYQAVDAEGRPLDDNKVVQIHAAYYTGMIDTVPHVPERCLVGGGMETAGDTRVMKVPLNRERLVPDPDYPATDQRPALLTARNGRVPSRVRLPVNIENLEMRITPFRDAAAKQKLFAGYFFIANGGVVATADDVRLLAFNLQDDYAYYAKIQFMSASVDSAEELAALAGSLLDELFPDLMLRLPDWMSVEEGLYPPDNPRRAGSQAGVATKP